MIMSYEEIKICKANLIPCLYRSSEWSELPCFGSQYNCNKWSKIVSKELPEVNLAEVAKYAKTMFNLGLRSITLQDVLDYMKDHV